MSSLDFTTVGDAPFDDTVPGTDARATYNPGGASTRGMGDA